MAYIYNIPLRFDKEKRLKYIDNNFRHYFQKVQNYRLLQEGDWLLIKICSNFSFHGPHIMLHANEVNIVEYELPFVTLCMYFFKDIESCK